MELRERNHFRTGAGSSLSQESDAAFKLGLTEAYRQTPLRARPETWFKVVALVALTLLILGLLWITQNNRTVQTKPVSDSGLAELGIVYAGSNFQEGEKRRAGLPIAEGLLVTEVKIGGPAERSGIRAGDLIVGINDTTLKASDSLLALLNQYRPGDKVMLTVLREAERLKVVVTLSQLK